MAETMKKTGAKKPNAILADRATVAAPEAVAAIVATGDIAAAALPVPLDIPAVELPALNEKEETMTIETNTTETVAQETETMSNRAHAAFGDMAGRAKQVMEKGQHGMGEVVDFNRGTVEAMVQSARVAAKGLQDIAAYTVDYGRGAIETANANTRRLYAVKSPTEFVQVQTEIAKSALDEAVAQTSKFTESYLKLVGEIVQPLSNRYALAAEKVKSAVAA